MEEYYPFEDPEVPFCDEYPPSYDNYYDGLSITYGNFLGRYVPKNTSPEEDKCKSPILPKQQTTTQDLRKHTLSIERYVMHYQGKNKQRKFTVELIDFNVVEAVEYTCCIDKWVAKFTQAKDFDPLIIERQSQLCGAAFPEMAEKKREEWSKIRDYASIWEVFSDWMESFSNEIPLVECLLACHFDNEDCKTLIRPRMPFYLLENPKVLCVAAAGIFGLRRTRSGTPHTWFTKYIFGRTIFQPGLYYPLALIKWLKMENWKKKFIFDN